MLAERDRKILEEFIRLRFGGYTFLQIKEKLSEYNLSDYEIQKYHYKAGEKVREIQENEVLNTRVLHAQRYEILYDWFIENDFDKEAIKMLENIERLVGLGNDHIGISIQNMIEKKPEKISLYKWENLTEKEHDRMKQLYEKVKK